MCFMCSGKQSRNGILTVTASCSGPSQLSPSAAAGQLSPPDLLNLKTKTQGCVCVYTKLIHFGGLFPCQTCSSSLPGRAVHTSRVTLQQKAVFCLFGVFYPTRKHQVQLHWHMKCFKSYGLYIKLRANTCRKVDPKLTWNLLHLKPWH